jgi:hypothetical protein
MPQTIAKILGTGLIVATIVLPFGAIAQVQKSGPTSPDAATSASPAATSAAQAADSRYQAPVGHRQPRPSDIPANVARQNIGVDRGERDLDAKLQICRGC